MKDFNNRITTQDWFISLITDLYPKEMSTENRQGENWYLIPLQLGESCGLLDWDKRIYQLLEDNVRFCEITDVIFYMSEGKTFDQALQQMVEEMIESENDVPASERSSELGCMLCSVFGSYCHETTEFPVGYIYGKSAKN